MSQLTEIPFASAAEIAIGCLDILLPPERETVAAYARKNRFLANAGGGFVGRWSDEIVPYLIEPQECLTALEHLTVCLVGPGQVAKTVGAENWLLYSVGADPADMLWYMQSEDGVEAYVKGRINPMIDDHEILRTRQGLKSVDDSLHFKRFRGMKVEFLAATLRNLINKSAPRIIADEIDNWQFLGDVKALLDVRRQTFGRQSKLFALSHPDLARGLNPERDWTSGIMAIYADSDRRIWWWPCPHCGGYSSPLPIASRYMPIVYPEDASLDDVERLARLECPINGCKIEDHHRRWMNSRGVWLGDGQEISQDGEITGERVRRDTAGFWIHGAMSPFVLGGIGGLARARVKAERELEASGEDKTVRQVMVKQWGVPYQPPRGVGSVDANDLAERADQRLRLEEVPAGVRFLVLAIDCQLAHFEWLVRGFGVRGESWVIAKGRVPGDPATSPEDWDKLLELIDRVYPLAGDVERGMRIRATGFDSGGQPGVTQQAYAAWARWRRRGIPRNFGKIAGRDAWSIIPLKGASGLNAPRLQVTYPDTSSRSNQKAAAGTVPIAFFNPNVFKDDLSGQLRRAEAGDWYVHFPWALRSKEQPHVWFEQLVAERRLPNGRWEKAVSSARNEALDLMVYAHIVAHLHGLSRLDWENPPAWAAEWDKNTAIVRLAPAEDANAVRVEAPPAPEPGPSVQVGAAAGKPKPGWVKRLA